MAKGDEGVTHSTMPCIIHEAFVSPGWTRALITTHGFWRISLQGAARSVTVSSGTAFPASESHSIVRASTRAP